jgi:sigma54-dependent transcription regulator
LNVADTQTSVLIQGESGTGKELLANLIHYNSRSKDRAYIKLNCGAIPETLLESELFGHERGAFTDARARQRGKFEEADGGTLFLDEIGEMSLSAQVRLLRVLQDGEFTRVGGNDVIKADVRVIAASNVDLERAVEAGTFRRDLFYRLSVFPSRLPPLRERAEDVHPLVIHFLEHYKQKTGRYISGISKDALARSPATTGRATSANWRTPSSAPSSSPRAARSNSTICPKPSLFTANWNNIRTKATAVTIFDPEPFRDDRRFFSSLSFFFRGENDPFFLKRAPGNKLGTFLPSNGFTEK